MQRTTDSDAEEFLASLPRQFRAPLFSLFTIRLASSLMSVFGLRQNLDFSAYLAL